MAFCVITQDLAKHVMGLLARNWRRCKSTAPTAARTRCGLIIAKVLITMDATMPPSVKKVEKAMEVMIADIQKQHLLPKQKEAFLCCAKCCDTADDLQHLQGWCVAGPHSWRAWHDGMHDGLGQGGPAWLHIIPQQVLATLRGYLLQTEAWFIVMQCGEVLAKLCPVSEDDPDFHA